MASSGILEAQELMGRNLQYRGNIKQRIQRQSLGDIGGFQVADEGGGHTDLFR